MVQPTSGALRDRPGALVISLDFELHWGVRDWADVDGPYRANLLGAREAVPRMLGLFSQRGIAATWATVGFLFATDREERERFSPGLRPQYDDTVLDPYPEPTGATEQDDPLHYALSLIDQIRATPRQEVGSHSFSHYYCLEEGQHAGTFIADVESAVEIARHHGVRLESFVFPRDQVRSDYVAFLHSAGFSSYRGNQRGWLYRPVAPAGGVYRSKVARRGGEQLHRALHLIDTYLRVTGSALTRWTDLEDGVAPFDIQASRFLRPYAPSRRHLDPMRLRRICREMQEAATSGSIFHLWWHPHNFGIFLDENIAFLERVLDRFAVLQDRHGMQSLTMKDVAGTVESARVSRS